MKPFYTNWYLRGKTLHLKYINKEGCRETAKLEVKPTLYVPKGDKVEADEGFYDIFGNPVFPQKFDSPKEAREFIKDYKGVSGFKICGFPRFDYARIDEAFPGELSYDLSMINIGWIDIETRMGETFAGPDNPFQPITAITLAYAGKLITLTTVPVKTREDVFVFNTERELLQSFLKHWQIADLDIISSWNGNAFDMPYIAKRLELIMDEDAVAMLSPFPNGVEYKMVKTKWGAEQTQVIIHGVAQLDLLELYRKFVLQKQESYKLDFIAQSDLGVGKLEFDGTLNDLMDNDPENYIEYNRIDVMRTIQINEKRKLVELAISIAYLTKCQYEDSVTTTRVWDVVIANYLKSQNIIVPSDGGDNEKSEKYEGAFVKDPQIGFHEWVMSFDLGSLYPSLMITYNISPDTMLPRSEFIRIRPEDIADETEKYKQAKAKADSLNATLCANGAMFKKDKQGFLPLLVERMIKERKVAKKAMMQWKSEAERVKAEIKKRKQT